MENSAKIKITDRIRLTCILMGGGRFWLMPEAATLRDALATALYSGKHPGVDERLDDGSTDIDTLDAYEYTIERDFQEVDEHMNITDFLDHLHKTRGWQLDADYYATSRHGGNGGKATYPAFIPAAAEYADGTKSAPLPPADAQAGV